MAIDPFQSTQWGGGAIHTIRRAGLGKGFELLEEADVSALPRLRAQGRMFDLVFVDGLHNMDATLVDFYLVHPMLQARHRLSWPSQTGCVVLTLISRARVYMFVFALCAQI